MGCDLVDLVMDFRLIRVLDETDDVVEDLEETDDEATQGEEGTEANTETAGAA